jgi:hypothetical protein
MGSVGAPAVLPIQDRFGVWAALVCTDGDNSTWYCGKVQLHLIRRVISVVQLLYTGHDAVIESLPWEFCCPLRTNHIRLMNRDYGQVPGLFTGGLKKLAKISSLIFSINYYLLT